MATFVQAQREQWAAQGEMTAVPAFERFEQELHTLVMALVHVGPDKSTNSCDAIRRIVDCTLEQIVSPYQRVVCADVQLEAVHRVSTATFRP